MKRIDVLRELPNFVVSYQKNHTMNETNYLQLLAKNYVIEELLLVQIQYLDKILSIQSKDLSDQMKERLNLELDTVRVRAESELSFQTPVDRDLFFQLLEKETDWYRF
jgi:hypothetical protein